MPPISALGWFHTAMGAFALICGIYTLYQNKEILLSNRSGLLYLLGVSMQIRRISRSST